MEQTQTTRNIAFKGVNSANVRLDNSEDTARTYDISANTDISGQTVSGFSGEVREESAFLASFNCYGGEENLSVAFAGAPISRQIEIMQAVQSFMADAREYVASAGLADDLAAQA